MDTHHSLGRIEFEVAVLVDGVPLGFRDAPGRTVVARRLRAWFVATRYRPRNLDMSESTFADAATIG